MLTKLEDFKIIAGDDFSFGFVFNIGGEIPEYIEYYNVQLLISRHGGTGVKYTLPAVRPNENGECLLTIPSEISSQLCGNYIYQIQITTAVSKVISFDYLSDGTHFIGVYDGTDLAEACYFVREMPIEVIYEDGKVKNGAITSYFEITASNGRHVNKIILYGKQRKELAYIFIHYDENNEVDFMPTDIFQIAPNWQPPKKYLKFYGNLNVIPYAGRERK